MKVTGTLINHAALEITTDKVAQHGEQPHHPLLPGKGIAAICSRKTCSRGRHVVVSIFSEASSHRQMISS
jgi:hypothetical protein